MTTTSSETVSCQNLTTDLFPQHSYKFNSDALNILSIKSNGTIYQYNEYVNPWGQELYNIVDLLSLLRIKSAYDNPVQYVRCVAKVHHFGFTCHPSRVDAAVDKLISIINDMSSSKWINASMYNLGSIQLGKLDPADPDRVCVFSYLAVKHNHEMDVQSTYGWATFQEGGLPPEFK